MIERERGSTLCVVCTQDIHKELEEKISKYHGQEDTILYASCFDANAGLFEVMLGEEDALFSDQLNHASIIDGVRLAKTNKYRYSHRSEPLPPPLSLFLTSLSVSQTWRSWRDY